MPIVTIEALKQAQSTIIDRLDELYSFGLHHDWSLPEQAEVAELQQRALMIHTELAQRELRGVLQTA